MLVGEQKRYKDFIALNRAKCSSLQKADTARLMETTRGDVVTVIVTVIVTAAQLEEELRHVGKNTYTSNANRVIPDHPRRSIVASDHTLCQKSEPATYGGVRYLVSYSCIE